MPAPVLGHCFFLSSTRLLKHQVNLISLPSGEVSRRLESALSLHSSGMLSPGTRHSRWSREAPEVAGQSGVFQSLFFRTQGPSISRMPWPKPCAGHMHMHRARQHGEGSEKPWSLEADTRLKPQYLALSLTQHRLIFLTHAPLST